MIKTCQPGDTFSEAMFKKKNVNDIILARLWLFR